MTVEKSLSRIHKLPHYLIDQIKAGEVIESPSALLKELLENALDAQSTQIDIEIENNGISKLLIKDNGYGMSYEDLPLAFDRHATSKIISYDDLYNLFTFGFRGEALASAASISRLNCISVNQQGEGGKISIEGGKTISHTPTQHGSSGTTIIVSDLFFNTPVRMKFIKGRKSEKKSLQRVLNGYILSNPQIRFSVKWDDEEKKQYPVTTQETDPLASRATQLFSWMHKPEELITFQQEYDHHKVVGIIDKNSTRSSSKRVHYLFANNRLFTEQSYHYLITQNCKKIWKEGEQGSYIIFIQAPPSELDVNVHPSKTRIKFEKSASVYALISSSLKNIVQQHAESNIPSDQLISSTAYRRDDSSESADKEQSYELQLSSLISVDDEQSIHFLHNGIILWTDSKSDYLLTSRDLFLHYLNSLTLHHDEEVPLLITPALDIPPLSEDTCSFLQNNRILIEQTTDNVSLLRTLPQSLANLPLKDFFEKSLRNSFTTVISWETLLTDEIQYKPILQAVSTKSLEQILTKNKEMWFKISYDRVKI